MANSKPSEIRLRDPLSEVTRKERRAVLGASAIGVVIVKSGLIPSRVSALGIEFNQTDQRALLVALGAVVTYFLIAFVVYGVSDLGDLAIRSVGSTKRGKATLWLKVHQARVNSEGQVEVQHEWRLRRLRASIA